MFVICDWRNENAEGIYEMSHCFVACFTIFTGPAFTFSIHWARCWCQEPHTAHTHTLLNPVYLSWTKCDTSGTSLSYPPSWWKVHWLQISFSYTVRCQQETHQWQTSQYHPSSATNYITVPMTTRLVAAYQRQVCRSDRWQLRQTVTVGLGWGK